MFAVLAQRPAADPQRTADYADLFVMAAQALVDPGERRTYLEQFEPVLVDDAGNGGGMARGMGMRGRWMSGAGGWGSWLLCAGHCGLGIGMFRVCIV